MNFISKTGLWTKRHSPELLIVGSIISMGASIALSCIATTKVKKVIDPAKNDLKEIREKLASDKDNKELKKQMTSVYGKTAFKLGMLYLPAALTTGLSITCMLGSHHIMKTRNLALASTISILETSYKTYRQRVQEKIGKEAEEKLFYNKEKKQVTIVDEDGKKKKETIEVDNPDPNATFEVLYGENQNNWSRDALDNFNFLMLTQDVFNNRLRQRGWVTLDEIYRYLGFTTGYLGKKRALAAKYLGWVYDPKRKDLDNFISFGLTYPGTKQALPEINKQITCNEPCFFLRFNPDGNILNDKSDKCFIDFAKDDAE